MFNLRIVHYFRPPMTPRPNIDVTRRPMFQTQRSAPPSSSETSSSPSSKAQRDESFTSVKRRRTTPPGWTTSANDVYGNVIGDDGNVETEELIRNEEFASANLVSFFLICLAELFLKADSHYAANLLQPVIVSCISAER